MGVGDNPGPGSRTDTRFFSSSPGTPCGCPVFSVSLVRRRLLFLAAAATIVCPCGQCHPSGTFQEPALPYAAPLTEGIGVHMYRHQHTGVGLLGHKKCHTLDTCGSFQVLCSCTWEEWCWLTNLGTVYLCVCLHRHRHYLETP